MEKKHAKRLFIFNPDCEMSIAAGGKYYTPPANVLKMAEDLAFLPAWLGTKEDRVVVKELPDVSFMHAVCEPLQLECMPILESQLGNCTAWDASPWGKSPGMCHWLNKRGIGEEWKPEQKEWYSRKTAREGLARLMEMLPFVRTDVLPQMCYSLPELELKVGKGQWIVKAPWSSSGKGILVLKNGIGVKEKEWLTGMLKRQKYLMLEKGLDKVEDFAMEFFSGADGVAFMGWSSFSTGLHGEYIGNFLGAQIIIERRLIGLLGEEIINALKIEIPRMIGELIPCYRGPLGVDMMIYRENGELAVQPCVEINLRYNMGIVAMFLSRRLCEKTKGTFCIRFYSQKEEALHQHIQLQRNVPIIYENNRIKSGYLNLTPVHETTHFVASVRCY